MAITFILRKKEYRLEGTIRVKEALEKLGLPLESYLVLRNGELINENEALKDGDIVKLVPVVSGG